MFLQLIPPKRDILKKDRLRGSLVAIGVNIFAVNFNAMCEIFCNFHELINIKPKRLIFPALLK